MKKLLAMLTALSLVVFTGCSGDKTGAKTGDAKTGSAKTDTTVKTTVTKTDTTVKTEIIKTDNVKTDTIKTDTIKTDTIKTDTVKTDTVKTDTVKTDTVKEPAKVEGKVTKVEGKTVTVKVGDKEYTHDCPDADAAKKFKKDDTVDVWLKDGKADKIAPPK